MALSMHSVFLTVKDGNDFVFKPGFLGVALGLHGLLFIQCLVRGCVYAPSASEILLIDLCVAWGNVFKSASCPALMFLNGYSLIHGHSLPEPQSLL